MFPDDYVALQGPVERQGDRLVLRVPLDVGGDRLRRVARTCSHLEGKCLVVRLPPWLAERMRLQEGSAVHVDDRWGRLNIARLH